MKWIAVSTAPYSAYQHMHMLATLEPDTLPATNDIDNPVLRVVQAILKWCCVINFVAMK